MLSHLCSEDGGVILHGALHGASNLRCAQTALGVAQLV